MSHRESSPAGCGKLFLDEQLQQRPEVHRLGQVPKTGRH